MSKFTMLQPSTLGYVAKQDMPHHLSILFRARPPLQAPQIDKKRQCRPLTGFFDNKRDYFAMFEDVEPPKQIEIEKPKEKRQRLKKEKLVQNLVEQKEKLKQWNPYNDKNIKSDPHKTLFISRLSYKTDEKKLKKEFEIFGDIRRIRVVVNQKTGKPRGYAFIEYESEKDLQIALSKGDGRRVDGKRVLVDIERGRTRQDWKPRSLGGGKGDTRRDREEEKLVRELMKSHELLRSRSRDREQATNGESHHNQVKRESKAEEVEKLGVKHRTSEMGQEREASKDESGLKEESKEKKEHKKKDKKEKSDKKDKKKKEKKDKKQRKHSRSQEKQDEKKDEAGKKASSKNGDGEEEGEINE